MNTLKQISVLLPFMLVMSIESVHAQGVKEKIEKLSIENKTLATKVDFLTLNIPEVVSDNKNLKNKIEILKSEYDELTKKVESINHFFATNIVIAHHEFKKNNSYKTTKKASKINSSVIWFQFIPSKDMSFSNKKIHLILYDNSENIVNNQSEIFLRKDDNSTISYSFAYNINYTRPDERYELMISYDKQLLPGIYKLELYTDGFLSGLREFILE